MPSPNPCPCPIQFKHASTDDHELIWYEAMAALGLDASNQSPSREIEIHVVSSPHRLYRIYRRWEEGWGIGTEAVLGGPDAAPAGVYTIISLVSRVFG